MNLLVMTLELVQTLEAVIAAVLAVQLWAGETLWCCTMLYCMVASQIGQSPGEKSAALHRTATTSFLVGTKLRNE